MLCEDSYAMDQHTEVLGLGAATLGIHLSRNLLQVVQIRWASTKLVVRQQPQAG